MIGHHINGFVIVAAIRDLDHMDETVIVGERKDLGTNRVLEYVTGRVGSGDPAPVEWWQGHYFNVSENRNLVETYRAALQDAFERARCLP